MVSDIFAFIGVLTSVASAIALISLIAFCTGGDENDGLAKALVVVAFVVALMVAIFYVNPETFGFQRIPEEITTEETENE